MGGEQVVLASLTVSALAGLAIAVARFMRRERFRAVLTGLGVAFGLAPFFAPSALLSGVELWVVLLGTILLASLSVASVEAFRGRPLSALLVGAVVGGPVALALFGSRLAASVPHLLVIAAGVVVATVSLAAPLVLALMLGHLSPRRRLVEGALDHRTHD